MVAEYAHTASQEDPRPGDAIVPASDRVASDGGDGTGAATSPAAKLAPYPRYYGMSPAPAVRARREHPVVARTAGPDRLHLLFRMAFILPVPAACGDQEEPTENAHSPPGPIRRTRVRGAPSP